ncbi:hypothetical protein Ahy_A03g014187 [Arachis hypogaea]|uniref:Aminotransferase-like plant mobile domain-containing protein n=1 Tax=Arachis hypogaea TaxID=3818 RepID=A0A445DX55_ARAHY|nr:hypothetical protein Ahy_A03g014187 [Arachis hypogaea]
MMLLSTQLFGDKSGIRMHIRWLPYVARLEDMGSNSWGSVSLSWLYRCLCRVANKNIDLYSSSNHGSFGGFRILSPTDLIPSTSCWTQARRNLESHTASGLIYFVLVISFGCIQLSQRLAGSASGDIRALTHCVLEVRDSLDILCCDRVASGRSGSASTWRSSASPAAHTEHRFFDVEGWLRRVDTFIGTAGQITSYDLMLFLIQDPLMST